MRPKSVRQLLDERPFQPLRVHMSNGEIVDITHPELALVTESALVVPVRVRDRIPEYVAHYNLLHIVKIEPSNGARTPRKRPRPKDK